MTEDSKIEVTVKAHGYGDQTRKTVYITREDIEELAIAKLREETAWPNLDVQSVEFHS